MKFAGQLALAAALFISALSFTNQALADGQAVRQCQAECIAAFERPSALLRQCVSNCVRLADQPAKTSAPATTAPAQTKK